MWVFITSPRVFGLGGGRSSCKRDVLSLKRTNDYSMWFCSPSGWNRFQPQIYRAQNRGTFFGLSYRKISGSNLIKISFFRISNISVPCLHAQLRGRTVITKLWTFFGPWGRDRSQSPPCWIFRVKQIHPSTASERTTRQVILWLPLPEKVYNYICPDIIWKLKGFQRSSKIYFLCVMWFM